MVAGNKFCKFILDFLASLFYVGHIPYCPGTIASFVTLITLFFLPTIPAIYFFYGCLILFFVGVFVSEKVAISCRQHDPSNIVIDEVLGMSVSLFLVPKIWWLYGVAFLVFRFFDISKLFGIAKIEKISWGWGIMMDDLAAGLLTLGVVSLIRLFAGF